MLDDVLELCGRAIMEIRRAQFDFTQGGGSERTLHQRQGALLVASQVGAGVAKGFQADIVEAVVGEIWCRMTDAAVALLRIDERPETPNLLRRHGSSIPFDPAVKGR